MKDLFSKALLGLAIMAPAAALADASNFNYVEGQYLDGEIEDLGDFDVDGWEFNGSVELTEQLFLTASMNQLEPNESTGPLDVELETQSLGLGYVFGQYSNGNVYGTVRYLSQELSVSSPFFSGSQDEDGYSVGLGTRMDLSPNAELRLELDYVDVADEDSFVPSASIVYSFIPQLAGVLEYSHHDDLAHTIGLGVRFYFR